MGRSELMFGWQFDVENGRKSAPESSEGLASRAETRREAAVSLIGFKLGTAGS